MKNCGDNVFQNVPVGKEEASLLAQFLFAHDFAANTRKAIIQDLRRFAQWFSESNREPFTVARVTVRDVADFRDQARRNLCLAVSTVNRCIVHLRRFLDWLVDNGDLATNPAKGVKELRRQLLAPKGLTRSEVRTLLREVELRQDIRAAAIFSLLLYTGCRVGDLVALERHDVVINERTGYVTFRTGKGRKQRTVPLPLAARRALQKYLDSRPPIDSEGVFIGERGPLTDKGIRSLCDKYSAICGITLHPHFLRHTMAHQFLENNGNDLVSLAQILGHENLNTTKRYVQRSQEQLSEACERLTF